RAGCLSQMCVSRRIPPGGAFAARTGPFLDRPHRLAGDAIERVEKRLLRRNRNRFDRFAVYRDVHQDWRGWEVPVPDVVMDPLELPQPLPWGEIEADDGRREEIASWTMAAEVVAGA